MSKINFFYRILVSSFVMSTFAEGVILPVYAIFVQKIGGDILDAGWAMGIFLITQGVFTIIVHRFKWTQRQRIWLMIFGWALWVVGIASYLVIGNTLMLFITQIMTAMGNAIADPIFTQELAAHTDKKVAELEWGIFEGSNDLVNGIGAIIGAAIVAAFGFPALIYIMILTATTSFVMILFYVSRLRRQKIIMKEKLA